MGLTRRRTTRSATQSARHSHYSPLRYPGGKAKLAPFIALLFESNHLCDGRYAEPYAGGAGVALALLYGDYASHIHINDLDRSIFAFWHCVLNETEEFCRRVATVRLSIAEWRRQHRVQEVKATAPLFELGFSTFFLNRTNRSGIIGSGGVIGGLNQTGEWGIDARYNARDLVRRIERVAAFRSRITLTNQDALAFIQTSGTVLPARSLVYLDPPYYVKGRQKLYSNYYKPTDHAAVATALRTAPWPWVVSYDAAPEIRRLYRDHRKVEYRIRYTAADSYLGSELIFLSESLRLARSVDPVDQGTFPKTQQVLA